MSDTEGNHGGGKPVREKWTNTLDFMFSCIGLAVGLGNIWRFPYLCYKNGGGAFLVPYFVFLLFGGLPLFIMEVGLGQYMSLGGLGAWNICPLFQGIGVATIFICFFMNIYYIVILAWALYYLVNSFTSVLPWSHCNNAWNTENCFAGVALTNDANFTGNVTLLNQTATVDPTVEFWERNVLQITPGIEQVGGLKWELTLCLFVMWLIVYVCVMRGVKVTGKVVYFTASFPYVILAVLLIRGVSLEGAIDGIIYYLKPDFSRLADPQVWIDGGTQVFFSYAIAMGALITLGSYNKYNKNFYRDSFIIVAINSGTSLLGGFAVFSLLGFMAHDQNLPISDVAEAGPGLVFIVYPKAVTQMPLSPLWAVLFFFMILLIGIDSQFVQAESFITPFVDLFPNQLIPKFGRMLFVTCYCVVSFLLGLTMVTRGGMYVFQIFDYYSASGMVFLWLCLCESIAIGWGFGASRFYDAMETMLGRRPSPWLKLCWKYFTPLITLGLLLFQIVRFTPLTYNRTYVYPDWAQALGIMIAATSILCVPVTAVFKILKANGSIIQRLKATITPELNDSQIHTSWMSDSKMKWRSLNSKYKVAMTTVYEVSVPVGNTGEPVDETKTKLVQPLMNGCL